jgi:hypothetical protein
MLISADHPPSLFCSINLSWFFLLLTVMCDLLLYYLIGVNPLCGCNAYMEVLFFLGRGFGVVDGEEKLMTRPQP